MAFGLDAVVCIAFIMLYWQFRSTKSETPANRIFFDLLALITAIALVGLTYDIASAQYSSQIAGVVNAVLFVVWIAFLMEIVFLLVALMFRPLVPKKYLKYVQLFD